jgi:serine/threonine protein kinase
MTDRTDQPPSSEPVSILEWVDQIADQYEAVWRSTKLPAIGDFLNGTSGERRAALKEELNRIDRAYVEQLVENHLSPASTPPVDAKPSDSNETAPFSNAAGVVRAAPERKQVPEASRPRRAAETPSVFPEGADCPDTVLDQARSRAKIAVPGYEILGELGRGGMGVVYKARHLQLKRLAALKMILTGAHASADQLVRFRREAGAAARLQHPNIVHVYEIGEHDGLPYFAQEFMAGGSLGQRLRVSALPPLAAAQIVATLAQAMQAAHDAGIIHRDLKPDNVLLTGSGVCKITDFGLAKQLDSESVKTQSDAIIGTPSYMAPEQASGKIRDIGPLSDVYALGAILYECLTGRPPFKAATAMDTLVQVRTEDPVPPRRLQPKLPRDLETICLKCLEKQPRQRYASAAALADDLKRFVNHEPIHARRVRSWERAAKWIRRRPAAAALVSLLVALGLGLPIAGLLIAGVVAERHTADQERRDGVRFTVQDEIRQVRRLPKNQSAVESMEWKQLDWIRKSSLKDPDLEDLQEDIKAVQTYRNFVESLEKARFFATLGTGETLQESQRKAEEAAAAALDAIDFKVDGQGKLNLSPSLLADEEEITTGTSFLLLMLAEIKVGSLPQPTLTKHAESELPGTRRIPNALLPPQLILLCEVILKAPCARA